MTPCHKFAAAGTLFLALAVPLPSPATAAEAARPAFEADSDLFELVGRIRDGRLTLTLDRWASNEPVADARIEIDSNGRQLVASVQADGTYALDATPFAAAATYPLAITITAGSESDLLAADLVVETGGTASAAAPAGGSIAATIAGALALLTGALLLILRRRRTSGESA